MAVAERHARAMGSEVHVLVVADDPARLLDDALAHLGDLESRWSRFLPASDITRLNLAGGRPVEVAPETVTLVQTMAAAWQATGGRYDPSVLPALVDLGFAASRSDPRRVTALPGDAACGFVPPSVDGSTVRLAPGLTLDPGGIGKGLAADLLVARLLARGAAGALVGVGGDLAMCGTPPDDSGWFVAVERPDRADGDLLTMVLDGGGVATSSTRSRRATVGAAVHHHVVDPRSGRPADTGLAQVSVVAASGWVAETHATAALLAGRAGVLAHLEAHDLTGVAVTDDGEVLATTDLAASIGVGA